MKLVKTDLYLLLINEEAEIKPNDKVWWEDPEDGLTSQLNTVIEVHEDLIFMSEINASEIEAFPNEVSLVIAYYPLTKEAKELDLPLLPNPFEEVDVEKLVSNSTIHIPTNQDDRELINYRNFYREGYKATQSKGQYSLEDINKAIEFAFNAGRRLERKAVSPDFSFVIYREKLIQSLSTRQLPKEFIVEEQYQFERTCLECKRGFDWIDCRGNFCPYCNSINHASVLIDRFKTTTNSQGKQELVGTYKY